MRHMRHLLTVFVFATATPAISQDVSATLNHIRETKTLTIGHREASAPFAFTDGQGKIEGFTIDLCEQIAEAAKREVNITNLQIKYIPVGPQTRIPLIANGTLDLECGSTTINISRQRQVDFSIPFFLTGSRMAVRRNANLHEIEDMVGKTIGFSQGTTDERNVRALIEREKIQNVRIANFRDHSEGMLALETNRIDAYIVDETLLNTLISRSRLKDDLVVTGRPLTFSPYGIMMRRNDSAFRLLVNRTLAEAYKSGQIQEIYKRWFGSTGIEMSPELRSLYQINSWDE